MKKHLQPLIDAARRPGQLVWDAFCGGLAMTEALSKKGPVVASDANAALINLYLAVQQGWDPPEAVSRAEYEAAKLLPDVDPRKAFCGFGCSFGARWFAAYVEPSARITIGSGPSKGLSFTRRYHGATGDVLKRQVPCAVRFLHIDFLSVEPFDTGAVLYLDPPYRNTEGYAGVGAFDYRAFDLRVRRWAEFGPVFVSEYRMPDDVADCVFEMPAPKGCTMAKADAVERLFKVRA